MSKKKKLKPMPQEVWDSLDDAQKEVLDAMWEMGATTEGKGVSETEIVLRVSERAIRKLRLEGKVEDVENTLTAEFAMAAVNAKLGMFIADADRKR